MSEHPPTKKGDRVLAGLRALCAEQTPGRAYSTVEIAHRCGCTYENIGIIERKAISRLRAKLRRAMQECDAPALREKKEAAHAAQ